jgi:hypothetical protein
MMRLRSVGSARSRVESAIADVAVGLPVVIEDHEREDAADLIVAAGLATPELVTFMIELRASVILRRTRPRWRARRRLDDAVAPRLPHDGRAQNASGTRRPCHKSCNKVGKSNLR